MSVLRLSVKHNRTLEQARSQLETAVSEVQTRFGSMVRRVEWSADHDTVKIHGAGVQVEMRVDAQEVHVEADVPLLARLLGGPFVSGLKGIVQQTFHKQLK